MNLITETFNEVIVFLKKPKEERDKIQTAKQKLKKLFVLLLFDFVVAVIVMGIAAIIVHFGLISEEDHAFYMLIEQYPVWLFALLVVIIMPFLEELIFRLPLRFKHNYLLRFTILLARIAGRKNRIKFEYCLRKLWQRYFGLTFYFNAIVFGLIHLTNFKFSIFIIIFAPILCFSQFIGGLLMGYLRVRYSFILGFIMHAVFNGITVCISLISLNGGTEKLDIDYVAYSLKIVEVSQLDSESSSNYSCDLDTIIFNAVPMKTIIAYLVDKNEYLISSSDIYKLDTKLTLKFINHNFSEIDVKETILKHLSNTYNFKIKYNKISSGEVYWIYIDDTTKLMTHKSNNINYTGSTTISESKIEFNNATLNEIANHITTNYKKNTNYPSDDTNKYDLTIYKKLEFETLQKHLHLNYGLLLKKGTEEVEYVYVDF